MANTFAPGNKAGLGRKPGMICISTRIRKRMTADECDEKQRGRPFEKGMSGNPSGRPRGSRNATTLALEALLDGQAQALTQKAIDFALSGDMPALRLCLDRILPPRKDRPVSFTLPEINSARVPRRSSPPCLALWRPAN